MAHLSPKTLLLGISGPQGAGKTTISELIRDLWPQATHLTFAFADAIKSELQELGYDTSSKTPEIRQLLQEHGARQRDRFGIDYWINQTEKQCQRAIQSLRDQVETLVIHITDVRMPREAEWVRSYKIGAELEKPLIIRIDIPEEIRKLRIPNRHLGEALVNPEDPTESQIPGITPDYLIINDGTLYDLENKVKIVLSIIQRDFAST